MHGTRALEKTSGFRGVTIIHYGPGATTVSGGKRSGTEQIVTRRISIESCDNGVYLFKRLQRQCCSIAFGNPIVGKRIRAPRQLNDTGFTRFYRPK